MGGHLKRVTGELILLRTTRFYTDIVQIATAVTAHTVALRLDAGSQEAGFLTPICPINSTPAIVVIKYESSALDASSHADRERNAQVQHNLQSAEVSVADLKGRLEAAFDIQDAAAGVTGSEYVLNWAHNPILTFSQCRCLE